MSASHEESLPGGLRYTELEGELSGELGRLVPPFLLRGWCQNRLPATLCRLWRDPEPEPVSYLTLFRLEQRFGETSLPVIGYGGVATPPRHRRKGYVSILIEKSLERAAPRCAAFFLNGISGFYTRWGFATCLLRGAMTLETRCGEAARPLQGASVRPLTAADHAAACGLFNREHALRPGTAVRDPSRFVGPRPPADWCPGDSAVALEAGDRILGYMIVSNESVGTRRPLAVGELVAEGARAAEALIADAVATAIDRRLAEITFHEVPDSTAGSVLRRLGCEARLEYSPGGGWMGRPADRRRLVESLAPELSRRAADVPPPAGAAHDALVDALASGAIYAESAVLMPLLTGYWSWLDAARAGHPLPGAVAGVSRECVETLVRAWFPGGGTPRLPLPFAYLPDHY